jgi:hypothetical protein
MFVYFYAVRVCVDKSPCSGPIRAQGFILNIKNILIINFDSEPATRHKPRQLKKKKENYFPI